MAVAGLQPPVGDTLHNCRGADLLDLPVFVPCREKGSTWKYQHEVERVPEGAARGDSREQVLVYTCIP